MERVSRYACMLVIAVSGGVCLACAGAVFGITPVLPIVIAYAVVSMWSIKL